ncbi:MAG TPA: response regulator, partial [Polyangia bacterium]
MKLLVVDDHPEARQMASRLLVFLGHEVHEAANAAEAEAFIAQGREVDVVIMDLLLGQSNGVHVADR